MQSGFGSDVRKRKISHINKDYLLLARNAGHYTESFNTDAASLPAANCLDHGLVLKSLLLLILGNLAHRRESLA